MSSEKVITIDKLAFGGEGVGRFEGKVVFVPWVAPGDKVLVRTLSDHGRYEKAELIQVLEKSPARVDPPCPIFGKCGGCQWQHLSYETQLKMKEDILREALVRVGKVTDPKILPMLPSPSPWNYRRRIQLKVSEKGDVGFYATKSHQVIPIDECKIADPRLNTALQQILKEKNLQHPFELLLTDDDKVQNHRFQAHHHDNEEEIVFTQINPEQNKNLIQTLLKMAFGNADAAFVRKKTIIELYAGSGNFTFPLAERAGQIIAVEASIEAVKRADEETDKKGLGNVEWIAGDAEWGLKKIYRQFKGENQTGIDLLVLDPPRHGAQEILDMIPLLRPRMILYVSCDPMTLSRDLNILCRRHYRLDQIQPLDMFPQTYHIESVAQLSLA